MVAQMCMLKLRRPGVSWGIGLTLECGLMTVLCPASSGSLLVKLSNGFCADFFFFLWVVWVCSVRKEG